ncbi:alkane 1-monooxygenase [Acinetobacter schindleri]
MNAPAKITNIHLEQGAQLLKGRQLDKKRFGWLLSPGLPVIGMGILAGYHFGPKATKKVFALGGPLLLHVIIPTLDALIGEDENNPSDDQIKALIKDPYYDRIVKLFIPLQMAANTFAGYVVSRPNVSLTDQVLLGISMGAINGRP